jgi:hypothetical protein
MLGRSELTYLASKMARRAIFAQKTANFERMCSRKIIAHVLGTTKSNSYKKLSFQSLPHVKS